MICSPCLVWPFAPKAVNRFMMCVHVMEKKEEDCSKIGLLLPSAF